MNIKKIYILLILPVLGLMSFVSAANPPDFGKFTNYLTDVGNDSHGAENVITMPCISREKSIKENIRNLFFPNPSNPGCSETAGGKLRDVIRVVGFVVLFIFIVMSGVKLILNAKDSAETKKAVTSIIYILYGAFLLFAATWILGTVLDINSLKGSAELVEGVKNGLFLQILSFFKVLAFFAAIVMVAYYGFKMMAAMDQADKTKAAKTGIINVIIALVLIKIIDYVFFIAQAADFANRAKQVILDVSKFMGYALGVTFVGALIYAGFTMITSGGKEETFKKARGYVVNIFISAVVIFLFLLVLYQIFNEFTG